MTVSSNPGFSDPSQFYPKCFLPSHISMQLLSSFISVQSQIYFRLSDPTQIILSVLHASQLVPNFFYFKIQDHTIKYYLNAGADKDKLVLGIPTYGRSYTLINSDATEIGSPADGPGEQGDATREKGYLAYYEICQSIKEDDDWTVVQPNAKAMGPYAFKEDQWVGYDDEDMARKKGAYVAENGLGGIMFWSIDNDDFRGACTGRPYPIIEAAKEAYLDSLG